MFYKKSLTVYIFLFLTVNLNFGSFFYLKPQGLSQKNITENNIKEENEILDPDELDLIDEDIEDILEPEVEFEGDLFPGKKLAEQILMLFTTGELAGKILSKTGEAVEEFKSVKKVINLPVVGAIELSLVSQEELDKLLKEGGFIKEKAKKEDQDSMALVGASSNKVKVGPLEITNTIFALTLSGKAQLAIDATLFGEPIKIKTKGIKILKRQGQNPQVESVKLQAFPVHKKPIKLQVFDNNINAVLSAVELVLAEKGQKKEEASSLQLRAIVKFLGIKDNIVKDQKGNDLKAILAISIKNIKKGLMAASLNFKNVSILNALNALGLVLESGFQQLQDSAIDRIIFPTLKVSVIRDRLVVDQKELEAKEEEFEAKKRELRLKKGLSEEGKDSELNKADIKELKKLRSELFKQRKELSAKISGTVDLSGVKIPILQELPLKSASIDGQLSKNRFSLNAQLKDLQVLVLGKVNNATLKLELKKVKESSAKNAKAQIKPELEIDGTGSIRLFGQDIPYYLQSRYTQKASYDIQVDAKGNKKQVYKPGFVIKGMLGQKKTIPGQPVVESTAYLREDFGELLESEDEKFELKIGDLSLAQPEFELNLANKQLTIKAYSDTLKNALGLTVYFIFKVSIENKTVSVEAIPQIGKDDKWYPFKQVPDLSKALTVLKSQTTDVQIKNFLSKFEEINIKDVKIGFELGKARKEETFKISQEYKMPLDEKPTGLLGKMIVSGTSEFFGLKSVASLELGRGEQIKSEEIERLKKDATSKTNNKTKPIKTELGLNATLSFELSKAGKGASGITLLDLLSIVPGLEAKIPKQKIVIKNKEYDNPIRALLTLIETKNTKISVSTLPAPRMSISGAISMPIKNDNPAFKVLEILQDITGVPKHLQIGAVKTSSSGIDPSLKMTGDINFASLKKLIDLRASLTTGDKLKIAPTLPPASPQALKDLFEFELFNFSLDFIARTVPSVGVGIFFDYKPAPLLGNITRDGKSNQALTFGGELNFTIDTFDVAGKMEGIWNKPFGLSELSLGNMGLKFSKRYDEFIAEIAAAASVATLIAAFVPSDFGVAADLTIGDTKDRAFINIGTDLKSLTIDIEGKNKSPIDLIMSGIKVINGYIRDYGNIVQKITKVKPEPLPYDQIKQTLDKFVGSKLPIQINDFNMKFSPLGAQIAGLETLPGFGLGGRITVFGKEAQAVGKLSLQGVEFGGYLPPLKIGALTISRSQSEASKKREQEVLSQINQFKKTFVENPPVVNKSIEDEVLEMAEKSAKPKGQQLVTALPAGPNVEFKVTTSGDVKLVINGLLELGSIFKSETDIEISANRINFDTETQIGSGDCAMGMKINSLGKDVDVKSMLIDPDRLRELGIKIEFKNNMITCINNQFKKILQDIQNALEKGEKAKLPVISDLVGALGVVAKKGGKFITDIIDKSLEIQSAYTETNLGQLADGILPNLIVEFTLGGKNQKLEVKGFDLKNPVNSTVKIAEALIEVVKNNINALFDVTAIAKEVGKFVSAAAQEVGSRVVKLFKGVPTEELDSFNLNPGEGRYFEIKKGLGVQVLSVNAINKDNKWEYLDLENTPDAIQGFSLGDKNQYWYAWGKDPDNPDNLKLTEITRQSYDIIKDKWKGQCKKEGQESCFEKCSRWLCECIKEGKSSSCSPNNINCIEGCEKGLHLNRENASSNEFPRRIAILNLSPYRTEFKMAGGGVSHNIFK